MIIFVYAGESGRLFLSHATLWTGDFWEVYLDLPPGSGSALRRRFMAASFSQFKKVPEGFFLRPFIPTCLQLKIIFMPTLGFGEGPLPLGAPHPAPSPLAPATHYPSRWCLLFTLHRWENWFRILSRLPQGNSWPGSDQRAVWPQSPGSWPFEIQLLQRSQSSSDPTFFVRLQKSVYLTVNPELWDLGQFP